MVLRFRKQGLIESACSKSTQLRASERTVRGLFYYPNFNEATERFPRVLQFNWNAKETPTLGAG